MRGAVAFFALGFVIAALLALFTAARIVATNEVSFCASCHEMKVFYETWKKGAHGPLRNKGASGAKCTECHLPHEGFFKYLLTKIAFGVNDYFVHITGKKASIEHWIEHWEHKKPYVHKAYESGCKSCHKELITPGIPLKAITAHKAYLAGETDKTCISCHHMVGHGDVLSALREAKKFEK